MLSKRQKNTLTYNLKLTLNVRFSAHNRTWIESRMLESQTWKGRVDRSDANLTVYDNMTAQINETGPTEILLTSMRALWHYVLLVTSISQLSLWICVRYKALSVNCVCLSSVMSVVPTPVKTIPELFRPAFGDVPKTCDAEPVDRGKPGWGWSAPAQFRPVDGKTARIGSAWRLLVSLQRLLDTLGREISVSEYSSRYVYCTCRTTGLLLPSYTGFCCNESIQQICRFMYTYSIRPQLRLLIVLYFGQMDNHAKQIIAEMVLRSSSIWTWQLA